MKVKDHRLRYFEESIDANPDLWAIVEEGRPNGEAVRSTLEWRDLKRRLHRAQDTCQGCGTRDGLTVAHRFYPYGGVGFERISSDPRRSDVVSLCWPCHQQVDGAMAGVEYRSDAEMRGSFDRSLEARRRSLRE